MTRTRGAQHASDTAVSDELRTEAPTLEEPAILEARVGGPLRQVALLGNHLPRQCGIATFTSDLSAAIAAEFPALDCFVLAMNETGKSHDYPARVRFELVESDIESYRRAADFLNVKRGSTPSAFSTSSVWPYPIHSVFNPGATRLEDGTTLLLCRVELRTGQSHLSAARSVNGVDGWQIDPEPTFMPHCATPFKRLRTTCCGCSLRQPRSLARSKR